LYVKPLAYFHIKEVNLNLFIMKTKILFFGAFLALTFFTSCSNEKVMDTTAVSSDDIAIESTIDGAIDDVAIIAEDQYAMQQGSASRTSAAIVSILPSCATVTTVITTGIWTRTIDFGATGCTLHNGNILKGKIIVSFANDFTSLTRTISYSFVGFYHNGKLIEGSKTITQTLKSTDLLATVHPVSTHTIDMSITFPDGKIYTRTGTRVKEIIEGFSTITNWEDNVFLVWGNHSTTLPNGTKITSTITTPLRFVMTCKMPFPVRGVVTITKNDATATLDFGNGDCDNLATMTKNGVSKEIVLRK
jgi:hypothetical protein